MMWVALVTIWGRPAPNEVSSLLNARGSGNTGCDSSPKTRPENQRLVGGVRPSARRIAGSGASATSGSCSTKGSTAEAGRAARPSGSASAASGPGDDAWSSPLHAAVPSATRVTRTPIRR